MATLLSAACASSQVQPVASTPLAASAPPAASSAGRCQTCSSPGLPPALRGVATLVGRDEADVARAGAEYAVSKEGTGGIVAATVIRTTRDVPVWRLWDSCKDNHTGQWWTIEQPSGTRDAYRRRFEVCASWSALDRVRRCTIRAGAVAVIGTGQSAFCEEGVFYPQNEQDYQLFLVHPEEVVVACVDYAECPDDIAMTCDAAARSCGR